VDRQCGDVVVQRLSSARRLHRRELPPTRTLHVGRVSIMQTRPTHVHPESGPPPATTYHRISIDRVRRRRCAVRQHPAAPSPAGATIAILLCPLFLVHKLPTARSDTAPNASTQSDRFVPPKKRCTASKAMYLDHTTRS